MVFKHELKLKIVKNLIKYLINHLNNGNVIAKSRCVLKKLKYAFVKKPFFLLLLLLNTG